MDISNAAISLLKFEAALQNLFQKRSNEDFDQKTTYNYFRAVLFATFFNDNESRPLADLELEKGLRDIRSAILFSITKITASPRILHFQSALALQCFTNEYLYNQSQEEMRAIQSLEELVKKHSKRTTANSAIPIMSNSYKALNEYEWCDLIRVEDEIAEVFKFDKLEPSNGMQSEKRYSSSAPNKK